MLEKYFENEYYNCLYSSLNSIQSYTTKYKTLPFDEDQIF
jgi:hypothetical protein